MTRITAAPYRSRIRSWPIASPTSTELTWDERPPKEGEGTRLAADITTAGRPAAVTGAGLALPAAHDRAPPPGSRAGGGVRRHLGHVDDAARRRAGARRPRPGQRRGGRSDDAAADAERDRRGAGLLRLRRAAPPGRRGLPGRRRTPAAALNSRTSFERGSNEVGVSAPSRRRNTRSARPQRFACSNEVHAVAAAGTLRSKASSPSRTSTWIVSPAVKSASSRRRASGFSSSRWIARFNGLAP